VPVVSQTRIGGVPFSDLASEEKVEEVVGRTMRGGAEIGELYKTGSAYYAPSAATIAMVASIVQDHGRLIPCSVLHQGEYGINGTFSGTIAQLGAEGIMRTFELPLTDDERERVVNAAAVTKGLVDQIE